MCPIDQYLLPLIYDFREIFFCYNSPRVIFLKTFLTCRWRFFLLNKKSYFVVHSTAALSESGEDRVLCSPSFKSYLRVFSCFTLIIVLSLKTVPSPHCGQYRFYYYVFVVRRIGSVRRTRLRQDGEDKEREKV